MSKITVFVVPYGTEVDVPLDSLKGVDPSNLDELCNNPDFISMVKGKIERSSFVLVRTANEEDQFTDVGLVCVCSDTFHAEVRIGAEYDKIVSTPTLKRKAALTMFKQVVDDMNEVGQKEAVRAGIVSMTVNLTKLSNDPSTSLSSKEAAGKLSGSVVKLFDALCERPCLYDKCPSFVAATQFSPSTVSRPELVNLETEYNTVMEVFYQACSDFVSLFRRRSPPPSVESSPLDGSCGGGYGLGFDTSELEFELEKERKKSEESSRIQAKYIREHVAMEAENKRLKSRVEELEKRPPAPTGPSSRELELQQACTDLQARNKAMESHIQKLESSLRELDAREKAIEAEAQARNADLQKKLDEAKLACKTLQDEIARMKAQPKTSPAPSPAPNPGQPTQPATGGSGFTGFSPRPGQAPAQPATGGSGFTGYNPMPSAGQSPAQPTQPAQPAQPAAGGSGFAGFSPRPGQPAAGGSGFAGYNPMPSAGQPPAQPAQPAAGGSGFAGFSPRPGQSAAGGSGFAGYNPTPNPGQPAAGGSGFGGFGPRPPMN